MMSFLELGTVHWVGHDENLKWRNRGCGCRGREDDRKLEVEPKVFIMMSSWSKLPQTIESPTINEDDKQADVDATPDPLRDKEDRDIPVVSMFDITAIPVFTDWRRYWGSQFSRSPFKVTVERLCTVGY